MKTKKATAAKKPKSHVVRLQPEAAALVHHHCTGHPEKAGLVASELILCGAEHLRSMSVRLVEFVRLHPNGLKPAANAGKAKTPDASKKRAGGHPRAKQPRKGGASRA